jgi:5,10-methylene-tetrahydrofolate dehydrogenase/methenyl tetrahydrofolate cyclohydrolase
VTNVVHSNGTSIQVTTAPAEDGADDTAAATAAAPEARLISGTAIAKAIREELKEQVDELSQTHSVTPGLAVVLVGERPDSATYVRMKKKAAAEIGFHSIDVSLPDTTTTEELLAEVGKLNADPLVHGILVQLPLPPQCDEAAVLREIVVAKDADGFSAENIGNLCLKGGAPPLAVPCTPAGCIELLQRSNVEVAGKDAVVIGRSNIVGMPVAALLQSMNATVTVLHSRTADLPSHVKRADIVVAAIGKAEYVQADWLKPGCVVIDVGINDKPGARQTLTWMRSVCCLPARST